MNKRGKWAAKQLALGNCRDCEREQYAARCNAKHRLHNAAYRRKLGQTPWEPGSRGRPAKGD